MSSISEYPQGLGTRRLPRQTSVAVILIVGVLLVLRLFLTAGDGELVWSDLVASAAFTLGAAIIGFAVVVPRALAAAAGAAASAAVVLAVLSVVALVIFFFSGAPFMLGGATWYLGSNASESATGNRRLQAARIVGATVMVASIVICVLLTATGFDPGVPH